MAKEVSRVTNKNGSITVTYDDGTISVIPAQGKPSGSSVSTLQSSLNSGGSTLNEVYLGTENVKAYKSVSPTGTVYETKAGTRDVTSGIDAAKKMYVTDPAFRAQWDAQVRAAGFESNDPIKSRILWDMAVDGAADWYSTSGGTQKVTPQQYLQWYSKTTGAKKENLPSRQVYMYTPESVNALIDKTLTDTFGRKPTVSEQKEFYTAIQKMINEGTVTTTKERINPKTGKKETYTVQTPGYSQEKAEAYITEKVKAQNPQDYMEAKSLEFADFLFGMRG